MKNHVNLIPWEHRRRQLIRLRLKQWSAVWGLGVLVAALIVWVKMHNCEKAMQTLLAKQRSLGPLETALVETEQMQLRSAELEAQEVRLRPFTFHQPPLAILGVVSRSAGPNDRKVWVRNLKFHRVQIANPNSAKKPTPYDREIESRLTLSGIGLDNLEVANFVANLRNSGVFAKVELRSSNRSAAGRSSGHSYLVECWYQ